MNVAAAESKIYNGKRDIKEETDVIAYKTKLIQLSKIPQMTLVKKTEKWGFENLKMSIWLEKHKGQFFLFYQI